jgi:hypothetical protein
LTGRLGSRLAGQRLHWTPCPLPSFEYRPVAQGAHPDLAAFTSQPSRHHLHSSPRLNLPAGQATQKERVVSGCSPYWQMEAHRPSSPARPELHGMQRCCVRSGENPLPHATAAGVPISGQTLSMGHTLQRRLPWTLLLASTIVPGGHGVQENAPGSKLSGIEPVAHSTHAWPRGETFPGSHATQEERFDVGCVPGEQARHNPASLTIPGPMSAHRRHRVPPM